MSIEFARDFEDDENDKDLTAGLTVPEPVDNDAACDHPECIAFRAKAKEVDDYLRDLRAQSATMDMFAQMVGQQVARRIIDVEDNQGDFLVVKAPPAGLPREARDSQALLIETTVSGYVLNHDQLVALAEALTKLAAE